MHQPFFNIAFIFLECANPIVPTISTVGLTKNVTWQATNTINDHIPIFTDIDMTNGKNNSCVIWAWATPAPEIPKTPIAAAITKN